MPHFKRLIAIASLVFACGAAHAHPFHGNIEPITESNAPIVADRIVAFLVGSRKLPLSWQGRQLKNVSTRNMPEGIVWVVVFQNPEETDVTRATLFIFLDELGNPIGANFKGDM